ncbi:UNVERIFIED_ORG: filamentous hemagglutinin [Rahnella aquatilis]
MTAKGDATLAAVNDINLNTMDKSSHQTSGKNQADSNNATRTVVSSGGDLTLSAGRDLNSQAAQLTADLNASLSAGRDVNLNAQQTSTYSETHGSKSVSIRENVGQEGTAVVSGGSTSIAAGRDITTLAAQVQATGDLALNAGRDVNITTAQESQYSYDEKTKTKKHLFSGTTTHMVAEDYATTEKASQLSGDKVSIVAGQDLTVKGSSVVGDGDVTLKAGKDLSITAATEEQSSYRLSEKKTSGMFSGGGLGVTFGSKSSRQQINQDGTTQSQSSSAVGSTGGNVNLIAGEQAHIGGSDVIAKNDVNIVGGSVTVDPGNDMLTRKQIYEQKQSGLTVSLSSPVTDALLSLTSIAKQASQTGDGRMKALYGVQAVEQGWMSSMDGTATQASQLMNGKVDGNLVQLQVNIGASKSKSTSELEQNQVTGSTITGGRNVAIVSTGANGQSGDITITGSGVTGNKVTLAAQNDLLLQAATNNSKQTSKDSSNGWSVGAHISLGKETGIGVQGNGYAAKGSSDGETTEYVNTRVNAKDNLMLSSGRDTVLSGAQALGDKITANIGRDLTLTSQQDTDDYQSKQQSISGGFSFTFGSMTGSASLSMSKSKTQSEYASVGDQSGLFAGNQGYDIYVGDHTQLNGAVIASTADAANNSLNTGTLGWDDIQNKANYSASSVGVSAGFSSSKDQGDVRHNAGGVLPVMTNASGSASGTTRSAVADGSITVRDTGQQTQDVSTLSRDTENANGHIDKIFDKQKIEENQAVAQAISQVGVQTMQNVVMQAQVNARSDALARLSGTAEYNKASPADQQKMLENSPEYIAAEQKYGIGSPFWTAGTAISGALAGLTGGDMSQALAGGLAPYLSLAVKAATTDAKGNVNEVENITGHVLAGAVVAYLQGGSVSGGAAGAATSELAAQLIAKELYPGINPENLTNEQKANVSALSTLAAGLAGGVAGNSSVAAGTGAVAGKTAVENNAESDLSKFEKDAEELRKKENEIFGGLPDTENPELTHNVVSPGLGVGVGIGATGTGKNGGGVNGGGTSTPKVPTNLQPFTNPAQGPVIPSDWVSKPGRVTGSIIYYPPGTDPSNPGSSYIRVMPPGSTPVPGLENGYWISVKNGQPTNPATGGTGTRGETHIPLPTETMPPKR